MPQQRAAVYLGLKGQGKGAATRTQWETPAATGKHCPLRAVAMQEETGTTEKQHGRKGVRTTHSYLALFLWSELLPVPTTGWTWLQCRMPGARMPMWDSPYWWASQGTEQMQKSTQWIWRGIKKNPAEQVSRKHPRWWAVPWRKKKQDKRNGEPGAGRALLCYFI